MRMMIVSGRWSTRPPGATHGDEVRAGENTMSDRDIIFGLIQSLTEEIERIPAHRFNAEKIESHQRGLAACQRQLDRIDAINAAFLNRRAELLARHRAFVENRHQTDPHETRLPGWTGRPRSRIGKALAAYQAAHPGEGLPPRK